MDTSPSPQLNKPAFGTSDFAVSQVDSREYIDATAEETCPAESVPMSEPRAEEDAAEAPSAASLEVMDQLKALAHNVTQGNRASFDESDAPSIQSNESEDVNASDPGEPQAPEPSISVLPRPTGFESDQVINDRPKSGSRVLALAGFAVAAAIGAGSSFALQAHLKSDDVAKAAAVAPVAAAPVIPPYLGTRLEELAQDVSSVQRGIATLAAEQKRLAALQQQLEQLTVKQQLLAAKQEQAGQSIAKLNTLEQARQKTPAPVQSRPAPVPSRAYVPPPPVEPAAPPPPPPQTASHPIPPLPVPMTR